MLRRRARTAAVAAELAAPRPRNAVGVMGVAPVHVQGGRSVRVGGAFTGAGVVLFKRGWLRF